MRMFWGRIGRWLILFMLREGVDRWVGVGWVLVRYGSIS
jgi:hypothetical protein